MRVSVTCKTEGCLAYVDMYMTDTEDDVEVQRIRNQVMLQLGPRCPDCGGELQVRVTYPRRDSHFPRESIG